MSAARARSPNAAGQPLATLSLALHVFTPTASDKVAHSANAIFEWPIKLLPAALIIADCIKLSRVVTARVSSTVSHDPMKRKAEGTLRDLRASDRSA
jgi:hypothetical protein